MALYHIEGTSLIGWSRVSSRRERQRSETSETALRIVQCLSDQQRDLVRGDRHGVVGSRRVIEARAQDRPDRWWASQKGIE
jgi:hypothetical protein